MPLRISFNLGDADLQHFAEVAQQTQAIARSVPTETIVSRAREVLAQSGRAQLAEFVKERFAHLSAMLDMLSDADWALGDDDRQRVINALACFSAPASHERPPATASMLDHAIMIELVGRDLEHDLAAYADFRRFREAHDEKRRSSPTVNRARALSQKREALQARMHTRRKRDLDAAGSTVRKLFSLFGV